MYVYKLVSNPRNPFSIATMVKSKGGLYSFSLDCSNITYFHLLTVKQAGI